MVEKTNLRSKLTEEIIKNLKNKSLKNWKIKKFKKRSDGLQNMIKTEKLILWKLNKTQKEGCKKLSRVSEAKLR